MELFSAKNELAKVGGHLNLGEEAIISVAKSQLFNAETSRFLPPSACQHQCNSVHSSLPEPNNHIPHQHGPNRLWARSLNLLSFLSLRDAGNGPREIEMKCAGAQRTERRAIAQTSKCSSAESRT
eukprot:1723373-Rhodomonas_salina.2